MVRGFYPPYTFSGPTTKKTTFFMCVFPYTSFMFSPIFPDCLSSECVEDEPGQDCDEQEVEAEVPVEITTNSKIKGTRSGL